MKGLTSNDRSCLADLYTHLVVYAHSVTDSTLYFFCKKLFNHLRCNLLTTSCSHTEILNCNVEWLKNFVGPRAAAAAQLTHAATEASIASVSGCRSALGLLMRFVRGVVKELVRFLKHYLRNPLLPIRRHSCKHSLVPEKMWTNHGFA